MRSIEKLIICLGAIVTLLPVTVTVLKATTICENWNAIVVGMSGVADTYFNEGDELKWTVIYDNDSFKHHYYKNGEWLEYEMVLDPDLLSNRYSKMFFNSDSIVSFDGKLLDWMSATEVHTLPSEYNYTSVRWSEPGWSGGKLSTPTIQFDYETSPYSWLDINGTMKGGLLLSNRGPTQSSYPVPEPSTMLLFGTCLIGLAGVMLRKR